MTQGILIAAVAVLAIVALKAFFLKGNNKSTKPTK
jgi:hypothetical protein